MNRNYIDCTGGISEIERIASGNMVKNSVNYEKNGNGYIEKRKDAGIYNTYMTTAIEAVIDKSGIYKMSDIVFSSFMPDSDAKFWFLIFGKQLSSPQAKTLAIVYQSGSTAYTCTDLQSQLTSAGIDLTSVVNLRFFVSNDRVLIADGINTNYTIRIDKTNSVEVRKLGLEAPSRLLSVNYSKDSVSYVDSETTSGTGMTVERGMILKLAYTYITKTGEESNPSPITIVTDFQHQYKNPDKALGYEYFLQSVTIDGFELPTLPKDYLDDIDAIRLYIAESPYCEGQQGFNGFTLAKEFKLYNAKSNVSYSFSNSSVKLTNDISYSNDISPASDDICEIGGVIGEIGLTADLRKKFKYSFGNYYRINIQNPNFNNYIARPLQLYMDGSLTSMTLSTLLVTGLDKIRFYADDFVTPIECFYQFISDATNGDNQIIDYGLSDESGWTNDPAWVFSSSYTCPDSGTESDISYDTMINNVSQTSGNLMCYIYSGLAQGLIQFILTPTTGTTLESPSFTLIEGMNTISHTFSSIDITKDYTLTIRAKNSANIKLISVYFYELEPSDKAFFYLRVPEINASSSNVIYLCYNGTGVTEDRDKTAEYGKPMLLSSDILETDQKVFQLNKIRSASDIVVTDNIFDETLAYTNSADRCPNLVSENYNKIVESDCFNNPVKNTSNWNLYRTSIIPYSYKKKTYDMTISNIDSYAYAEDFVWWSDTPTFTISGFYDASAGLVTEDYGYILWQSGRMGGTEGVYVYFLFDGDGKVYIKIRVFSGSTGTVYTTEYYPDNSSLSGESFYYAISFDFSSNNIDNRINIFIFDKLGRIVKNSITSVSNIDVYDECKWGSEGTVDSFYARRGDYSQFGLYRDIFCDSIDKARGLCCFQPYFPIDNIGWLSVVNDNEKRFKCDIDTTLNTILVDSENVLSLLDGCDFMQLVRAESDDEDVSTKNVENNGWYHILTTSYSALTGTTIGVLEPLTTNMSGVYYDLYFMKANKNIDFDELTLSDLVTYRKNYIQWSNVNSISFPDGFIKSLKEIPIRIIPAPSFLQFEYQNTFLIFYRNSVDRFVFSDNVEALATSLNNVIPESSNMGLKDVDSIVITQKALYWRSEVGIIEWDKNGMRIISEMKIGDTNVRLIDLNTYTYIGGYIQEKNQVIFHDNYSSRLGSFVFDLVSREWRKFSGLNIVWNVLLNKGNLDGAKSLFLDSAGAFKSYPSTTTTTQEATLTKEIETYYSTYSSIEPEVEGATNSMTVTYSNEINGNTYTADTTFSNIVSFKKYGLPTKYYGNKLKILFTNLTKIKPFVLNSLPRKTRR